MDVIFNCLIIFFGIQMDVISHRLITALGMIGHGNKAQGRMADANMSCRKMAAHHPDIFLR